MNQDIKKRWIDRLRSGQDEQGQGTLHRGNGSMCCLGVLCAIAVENGVIDPPTLNERREAYGYGASVLNPDLPEYGVLPRRIVEWAGLSSHNPRIKLGGDALQIAEANDQGATFADLADVIEAQL